MATEITEGKGLCTLRKKINVIKNTVIRSQLYLIVLIKKYSLNLCAMALTINGETKDRIEHNERKRGHIDK